MEELRSLGLRTGWTYEVVICSSLEGSPHAAPAGVWTDDGQTLSLDLFETSRTLGAVLAAGAFVADFPRGAEELFTVMFAPSDLRFSAATGVAAPCLADSSATVALELSDVRPCGARTRLTGRVVSVKLRDDHVHLINRAESMLLESLIIASRIDVLGREAARARLVENRRVAAKVAPDSAFAESIDLLVHSLSEPS
jgi:hypothetical protein